MIIFGLGARQTVDWSRSPRNGTLRDAGLADDPARLVAPVVPGAAHREEALVPDDLGDDLEADPLEARGHLGGVDAGVPDVADLEGRDEGERLGPVDPGVAREGRVAVALGSPVARPGAAVASSRRWPSTRMYGCSAGPSALYTPSRQVGSRLTP